MKSLLHLFAPALLLILQSGCANHGDSRAEPGNHYQNISAQGRAEHTYLDAGQPR